MKVDDVRLHLVVDKEYREVMVFDQDYWIFDLPWGGSHDRTKSQAIAIAKRLCERFNDKQEKKS